MEISQVIDLLMRLGLSVVIGGLIGLERQIHGRWAGLRTHMTVSLGAAVFAIVGAGVTSGRMEDATRVIQGVAAGIGFLGAGTILKLSDNVEVKGLTTASAIWLTAALGTAAGFGQWWVAGGGTIVALLVLAVLRPFDKRFDKVPDDV